jgi:hypothetical protein
MRCIVAIAQLDYARIYEAYMSRVALATCEMQARWAAAASTLRICRIAIIGLLLCSAACSDPSAGGDPNTFTAATSYGVMSMQVHGFCAGHTNADMVRLVQASVAGRGGPPAQRGALARPLVVWYFSSRPARLEQTIIRVDLLERGGTVDSVSIIIPEIEAEPDAASGRLLRATLTRLMGANPA